MRQTCRVSSLFTLVALVAGSALGATVTVTNTNDSGFGSLRDAIAGASAGDTIAFSITGTITVASSLSIGKNLTISGPGASSLTISGNNATQILVVQAGITATVSGVTIANANTNGYYFGGAILIYGGALSLDHIVATNNVGSQGAILNVGGALTLTNSTLSNNSASYYGGGIENAGDGPTTTIMNSTISGNYASTFGGGLANLGGAMTLINSTISGNTCGYVGGGILNNGTMSVVFSTIADNTAPYGGGIYSGFYSDASLTKMKNVIDAGNHNGGNCTGDVNSLGHNLSDDTTCSLSGPGDLNNTPAGLDPAGLQNNGGPTQTVALLHTSPAVDAVPLASCTDVLGNPVAADQRGFPRPQGIACDIGSVDTSSDTTPPLISPVISGLSGSGGWYRGPVSVSWNVADPESGISSSSGCGPTMLTADTTGTTLTCSATNGVGLSSSASTTVKLDQAPPTISGMPASGCTIWPPNKKMVQAGIVAASDALSGVAAGSLHVTGTSNEPSDPNNPDIVITPNGTGGFVIQLRADRLGNGTGRVYTLTATASDLAGNPVTSVASCVVPHDQGN